MNAVILISGNGTNLQSIAQNSADIGIKIVAVICDVEGAAGINRAQKLDLKTHIISSKKYNQADFERKITTIIFENHGQIIILAGFMQILSADFIKQFQGKIINIHPSLLPKFKGLNTHKRAIEAAEANHGSTVHFVVPEVDSGEIIMQKSVKIAADDTPETLAAKVLKVEHFLYSEALKKVVKNLR